MRIKILKNLKSDRENEDNYYIFNHLSINKKNLKDLCGHEEISGKDVRLFFDFDSKNIKREDYNLIFKNFIKSIREIIKFLQEKDMCKIIKFKGCEKEDQDHLTIDIRDFINYQTVFFTLSTKKTLSFHCFLKNVIFNINSKNEIKSVIKQLQKEYPLLENIDTQVYDSKHLRIPYSKKNLENDDDNSIHRIVVYDEDTDSWTNNSNDYSNSDYFFTINEKEKENFIYIEYNYLPPAEDFNGPFLFKKKRIEDLLYEHKKFFNPSESKSYFSLKKTEDNKLKLYPGFKYELISKSENKKCILCNKQPESSKGNKPHKNNHYMEIDDLYFKITKKGRSCNCLVIKKLIGQVDFEMLFDYFRDKNYMITVEGSYDLFGWDPIEKNWTNITKDIERENYLSKIINNDAILDDYFSKKPKPNDLYSGLRRSLNSQLYKFNSYTPNSNRSCVPFLNGFLNWKDLTFIENNKKLFSIFNIYYRLDINNFNSSKVEKLVDIISNIICLNNVETINDAKNLFSMLGSTLCIEPKHFIHVMISEGSSGKTTLIHLLESLFKNLMNEISSENFTTITKSGSPNPDIESTRNKFATKVSELSDSKEIEAKQIKLFTEDKLYGRDLFSSTTSSSYTDNITTLIIDSNYFITTKFSSPFSKIDFAALRRISKIKFHNLFINDDKYKQVKELTNNRELIFRDDKTLFSDIKKDYYRMEFLKILIYLVRCYHKDKLDLSYTDEEGVYGVELGLMNNLIYLDEEVNLKYNKDTLLRKKSSSYLFNEDGSVLGIKYDSIFRKIEKCLLKPEDINNEFKKETKKIEIIVYINKILVGNTNLIQHLFMEDDLIDGKEWKIEYLKEESKKFKSRLKRDSNDELYFNVLLRSDFEGYDEDKKEKDYIISEDDYKIRYSYKGTINTYWKLNVEEINKIQLEKITCE